MPRLYIFYHSYLSHTYYLDVIGICLKPEKIIYDLKGWKELTILGVAGTTFDTIRFKVANFENKDREFMWGA